MLHEQTGQFSDALVPGIRLLTGSKVRTATAGTFTLGKFKAGGAGQDAAAAPVWLGRQEVQCKHGKSNVDANWRTGSVKGTGATLNK